MPYAVVTSDGVNFSFAAMDATATTFMRALASNELTSTTFNTAAVNLLLNSTNTNSALDNGTSYNSLTFDGGTLTLNGLSTMVVGTSNAVGGILAYGGGKQLHRRRHQQRHHHRHRPHHHGQQR